MAAVLANASVLPMDHRRIAAGFAERLQELQASCKGAYDFSQSTAVAGDLVKGCGKLFERIEQARKGNDPAEQASLNRLMMELNRILTPALLTDRPVHRHQPAKPSPDLPGLSPAVKLCSMSPESAQTRFLKTQLKREENGLIRAMTKARERIAAHI